MNIAIHTLTRDKNSKKFINFFSLGFKDLFDQKILVLPDAEKTQISFLAKNTAIILYCQTLDRYLLNEWLWGTLRKVSNSPLIIITPWSQEKMEERWFDDTFFIRAYPGCHRYLPTHESLAACNRILPDLKLLTDTERNTIYIKGATNWIRHLGVRHFGISKYNKEQTLASFQSLKNCLVGLHPILTNQNDIILELDNTITDLLNATEQTTWFNIAFNARRHLKARLIESMQSIKEQTL